MTSTSSVPPLIDRTQYLGGSDAAAVVGLDPYRSPYRVWIEKTGQVAPSADPPSEAAYWGQRLEDLVAQEFSRQSGKQVRRSGKILRHPRHAFLAGHLDRLIVGDGPGVFLECKTAGVRQADQWAEGQIPDAYVLQIHHYLALTGAPHAYVAVLIGGQEFRWMRVDRDETLITWLVEREVEFWTRYVEPRVPPPVDPHPDTWDAIRRRWPVAQPGRRCDLSGSVEVIRAALAARAQRDLAEAAYQQALAAVQALVGEAEDVYLLGERIASWKTVTRRTVDWDALRRDYPDVVAQYERPTQTRVWRWASGVPKEVRVHG